MADGWAGELVRLVAIDRSRHFDNCLKWVNDPDVTEWLAIGDKPMGRAAEEKWFDSAATGGNSIIFAIETLDGRHIGMSGLHDLNFKHGIAKSGSYIADPSQRGRGYGTDAAKVRARYAFEVLGLRMLTSEYFGGNEGSARMQAKAGYLEYGRLPRAFWKRGEFRDMVFTYLDRDRWQSLVAGGADYSQA